MYGNPTSNPGSSTDYEDGASAMPKGNDEPGQESDEKEGATAVLPKSVLGGKDFKPGEEVVLKILRVHENEVEVEYASEDEQEPPKEEGGGEMEPKSDMSSMMEDA